MTIFCVGISHAQTPLKQIEIEYAKAYNLETDYSIIFDNPASIAKLKAFNLEFYSGTGTKLGETVIETYPRDATLISYQLADTVSGLEKTVVNIHSLYDGANILEFPVNNSGFLALTLSEVPEIVTPPPPPPQPPEPLVIPQLLTGAIEPLNTAATALKTQQVDLDLGLNGLTPALSAPDLSDIDQFKGLKAQLMGLKSADTHFTSETIQTFEDRIQNIETDIGMLDIDSINANRKDRVAALEAKIAQFNLDHDGLQADVDTWKNALNQDIFDSAVFDNLEDELTVLQTRQTALEERADTLSQDISTLSDTLSAPLFSQSQIAEMTALKAEMETPSPSELNWLWVLGALGVLGVLIGLGRIALVSNGVDSGRQAFGASKSDPIKLDKANVMESFIGNIPEDKQLFIRHILQNNPHDLEVLLAQEKIRVFPDSLSNPTLGVDIPFHPDFDIEDLLAALNPPPLQSLPDNSNQGHVFAGSAAGASQIQGGVPHPDAPAPPIDALQGRVRTAIGRIGKAYDHAYESVHKRPMSEDPARMPYSRGTGVLLTRKHVMTNRHVYENLIKTGDISGCGIDFLALEDVPASYFHPFDGNLPILLDNLDIAIFTLADPLPEHRPIPVKYLSTPPELGTNVSVVGYPHPIKYPNAMYNIEVDFRRENIQANMYGGKEATLSIKRESQGSIFRPRYFPDGELSLNHKYGDIPVFCFNATACSGSSGSPILDVYDDTLLGIYFADDADFYHPSFRHDFEREEDPANLAMPINLIIETILRKMTDPIPTDVEINDLIEEALDADILEKINMQFLDVA